MAYPDYVEIFRSSVPEDFHRATARGVVKIYKTAFTRSNKLPEEQARNLRPYLRWCLLDAELFRIGSKLGMQPLAQKCDGGSFFVQLASGRVKLTASSVENPSRPPRRAAFRETLARESVTWLFKGFEDAPSDDDYLYAILIHAADPENPRLPWFANIRFPLPNCKKWATGKICLLDRFPTFIRSKSEFSEEQIKD